MKAFYGGQILPKHRGDMAVVISRQSPQHESYEVFVEGTLSENFNHLTGPRAAQSPLERVYIGVSSETGDRIAALANGKCMREVRLRGLDEILITPHFLDKYPEKPKTIILTSTPDGYAVETK